MARNIGYLTAQKTKKSDECYTPKYAVLPVLEFIKKEWIVWCPFDTPQSQFVKVIQGNGNPVISSHLEQGKDFFQYEPKKYDIIISNPPYSIKDQVIERCYQLNKKFMLLMPLPSLQGKFRYNFFVKGVELIVFDGRICYFKAGYSNSLQMGNSFASSYFCRNVLPEKLIFRRLSDYLPVVKKGKFERRKWIKIKNLPPTLKPGRFGKPKVL